MQKNLTDSTDFANLHAHPFASTEILNSQHALRINSDSRYTGLSCKRN